MTRAIYIRTSTDDQHGDAQFDSLRRAAAARGWGDGFTVYRDIGESGAKASRPAWDRLRRDVREGRVTEVMVAALDRVGRSALDVLGVLTEWHRTGVVFVSLRDGIDLGSAFGRFQAQVIAAFAELERAIIVQRVNAGIAAARAKGTKLGRPKRVLSWPLDELRKDAQALGVRALARLRGIPEATLRAALKGAQETPPKSERPLDVVSGAYTVAE